MTKGFTRNFSILSMALGSLLLSASVPALAADPQSDSDTAASAAAASSVKVPVQAPAVKAPTPPTVAATPQPTPPAPAAAPTASIVAGELTISHARVVYKKDHLDLFLSIKNAGNSDERLGGVDSPNGSGVVQVTKDKEGKEQEGPVGQALAGEKTTEFAPDATWLRIKDVKAEPKSTDLVPVTLYFRRSPNATLKVSAKGGVDSGSVLDWLKK